MPTSSRDSIPYAFVISANIHRRHLTAEQKRELIAKLIKATPEKSDRQIAETVKASPTTVGTVRAKMEAKGEVSKLDTRTDAKGVKQPATKPARARGPTHVCWQCRRRGEIGEVQQHHYAQYEDADVWLHDACISAFDQAEQLQRVASAAVEEHFLSSIGNKTRDDIGAASNGENARLRARNEELESENQRLQRENIALRSEIEELRGSLSRAAETKSNGDAPTPLASDDGLDIPDWRRTAP